METTDFTPAPAADAPAPAQRSWRPADYYASTPRRPSVPRWLTLGCGGLAVVVLLVVFIGGAVLSTSAINEFMDMALGMTMGEVRGMYAKDLGAAEKKAFESEVEGVRQNLRDGTISVRALDPLMQSIRAASGDNRIDRPELEQMQVAARKINSGAKRK
ncbi:MAG: hypothetical protein WA208_10540 [Thermoanaerobaculia bacterium]